MSEIAASVKKSEQCEMGVENVLAFIDTYTESPNHQGPRPHRAYTRHSRLNLSEHVHRGTRAILEAHVDLIRVEEEEAVGGGAHKGGDRRDEKQHGKDG